MSDVEKVVLEALRAHPRDLDELVQRIDMYSPSEVRRAVWHLLDADEVQVNWESKLQQSPPLKSVGASAS